MVKRFFAWAMVIVWMGVIFMFSAQPAEDSKELSNGIVAIILNYLGGFIPSYIDLETIVRKLAHTFEYAVLGVLVINAFGRNSRRDFIGSLIVCFLYSVGDEVHQFFVPGRGPMVVDVVIDSAGALIGILLYLKLRWGNVNILKENQDGEGI